MSTLSIVVPTCEKQEYLAYSLASLGQQTNPDFQLVVVDDGGGRARRRSGGTPPT